MKPHILIIGNQPTILEMMCSILKQEETYQITTMGNLSEDINAIQRLRPDLILLDIPTQGRQPWWIFLQKLKQHPLTKDIPIVIATTALPSEIQQEALFTQIDIPVLYMPFKIVDLLHLVEQAISQGGPMPSECG